MLSEMYTEPQYAALLAGDLDVGFVRDVPGSRTSMAKDLRLDVIDREPLLLALPSGHPLAQKESIWLREVAMEAFVVAATRTRRHTVRPPDPDRRQGQLPAPDPPACAADQRLAGPGGGRHGAGAGTRPCKSVSLAGVSYLRLEDPDAYMLLALASRGGQSLAGSAGRFLAP